MADQLEEKAKQYMSVRTVIFTSLISAFGFVLALFWNDAVKSAIEQIIPTGDTILAKFIAAVIVTIVVVVIIYLIIHSQRLAEKRLEEMSKSAKDMEKLFESRKKKILKGSKT